MPPEQVDDDAGFRSQRPDIEPDILAGDTQAEQAESVAQWVEWAKRRLNANDHRIVELECQVSTQRTSLKEARRKVDAYEEVLKARGKVTAFEPGRVVCLINSSGREATVLRTILHPGGVVQYRVGWWDEADHWREATLPADEVEPEMPLIPPKP